MGDTTHLTPNDAANLLAGHAIGYATSFLSGRTNAEQLAQNTDRLQLALIVHHSEPAAKGILDPVRMLSVAMRCAASAEGDESEHGWQMVMGALVELVRHESRKLRVEQSDQETAV